jgi:plastocyanin
MVALLLLALMTQQPSGQSPAAAAPPPATPLPPVPPVPTSPRLAAPSVTPRPTATPETITSIIVRVTSPPFPTSTPHPANLPTVSIVDFSFTPGNLRIKAGQTVTWRNDGTEQHDVTGPDWHSGPLDPTYTYLLTFGLPGTFAYRCSIHLDMTGSIIVS